MKISSKIFSAILDWNVNGLLNKNRNVGNPTNCSAICGLRSTVRCGMLSCEILGTAVTCSGVEHLQDFQQLVPHLRHRYTEDLHEGREMPTICSTVWPMGPAPEAAAPPLSSSTLSWSTGCWVVPERRRVVHFVHIHPSLPSSGAVRCGA